VNFLATWWPWLAIAAISGGVNILVAIDELFKECRRLPFFQPYRSTGFWLWVAFQFSIPAILAWFLLGLTPQPPITLALAGRALGFGLGFVVVLNSRTDIAALPTVDIKKFYTLLVQYAKTQIADQHTGKTTAFRGAVKAELKQQLGQFPNGFEYLKDYFDIDIALTPDEKKQYQTEIALVEAKATPEEQVKAAWSLLEKVRRRDLPAALRRFGCSETLVQQYFPKAAPSRTLPAPPS
jgi:hypothetical protein